MAQWNAAQYLKFKECRTQPAIDLANAVFLEKVEKAADIGCGPGNSTAVLQKRFPSADIIGVDNSSDMLEAAQKNCPACRFICCDVSKELYMLGQGLDLVFSNACLQWMPEHQQLLKDMMGLLNRRGVLAVQIPLQREQPVHQVLRELALSDEYSSCFSALRDFYILTPTEYFALLSDLTDDFRLWKTVYYHQMDSCEALLEWYRGTALRPYLAALPQNLHTAFEAALLEQIKQLYPPQKNGKIMFDFPRLFFTAVKK